MKKTISIFAALALTASILAFQKADKGIGLGDKAPKEDLKMEDVSGKVYTLKELKKNNGLLVIFSCNTCPFVLGWEDKYPALGKLAADNNIGMVLVNSNEAKREDEDSMEEMKKKYESGDYNTPYVLDKDHQLADAFGAQTTPHVFLFDENMKLVYKGLIDDKYDNRDKNAGKMYLRNAMEAMLAGEKIDPASTPEKGCSIKRVKS